MMFSKLCVSLGLLGLSLADTFTNPLRNPSGSDPFIVYTDDYFFLLTTTWTDVEITRATTLEGLKTATKKSVYSNSDETNVWSPELHWLDDQWWIYFTSGSNDDLTTQQVHVLEGGTDAWDDSYSYVGVVVDQWSIDGTVLRFSDWGNYLAFSCISSASLQSLCVAPLESPSTIGTVSVISQPTNSWETVGLAVNEAPAALYYGGKTFLTFSASYCWTASYSLGLLTWDGSTDPASSSAWTKTGPVLSSANGNYGTGSNGFFQSPDLSEIWITYHATSSSSGACDDTRYTMAQEVSFSSSDVPNFGTALALGTSITGPSGE